MLEQCENSVRTVCSNSGLGEVLEKSNSDLRMVLEQGVLTAFQR